MQIERAEWSAEAETGLNLTFRGHAEKVRQMVESEAAELWRINAGESWMVTRLEDVGQGMELNVICLQGRDIHPIVDLIFGVARVNECKFVRFHTQFRGLGRMLNRHGFELEDLIFRARV